MRPLLASLSVILVLVFLAGSAAAADPVQSRHAFARTRLSACLKALTSLPVGSVRSRTPEVPKRNREQAAVQARCANGSLSSLADSHPSDAKLVAAASALQELDLGVLDYGQYLVEVAFDKQLTGLLHQAEREIATGRAEAKRTLAQLGH